MNNQGPFDHDNNQFVVSYELLLLLKWLLDYEQPGIRKLIAKALNQGLDEFLYQAEIGDKSQAQADDLQQNIVDFFAVLDGMLGQELQEQEVSSIMQRHLLPAIDHLDPKACGINTVAVSIAKATAALENKPNVDGKAILCKELLKNWKPSKTLVNH